MFEVGFTELLLIAALALLVLGPQKLPKLAQQVGRWVGRARSMARQFRDQLEEEAHSIETKMTIDPGIDTSLDSKPGPAASATPSATEPATPAAEAPAGVAPASVAPVETEEDFYPPDHHMHPANRAAAGPAAEQAPAPPDGAQGELDLTTTAEAPPKPS
jgi:sec-independent protein translocase protein TatB